MPVHKPRVQLLTRAFTPVKVANHRFRLGHLYYLAYDTAASDRPMASRDLISLGDSQFRRVDFDWLPASGIPAYSDSLHWEFRCRGSWLTANVVGVLELIERGGETLQAGVQVSVGATLLGRGRIADKVIEDLFGAILRCYPANAEPETTLLPMGEALHYEDDRTYAYSSVSYADDGSPTYIFRVGNRRIWDPYLFARQSDRARKSP